MKSFIKEIFFFAFQKQMTRQQTDETIAETIAIAGTMNQAISGNTAWHKIQLFIEFVFLLYIIQPTSNLINSSTEVRTSHQIEFKLLNRFAIKFSKNKRRIKIFRIDFYPHFFDKKFIFMVQNLKRFTFFQICFFEAI